MTAEITRDPTPDEPELERTDTTTAPRISEAQRAPEPQSYEPSRTANGDLAENPPANHTQSVPKFVEAVPRSPIIDDLHDSAVIAFLQGLLANQTVAVTELEARARAAGLLGERQRITHSKVFKRVKKLLGIKSVRHGFGLAGEWFWKTPPRPGSEIPEPAGHLSTNQSSAVVYSADLSSTEKVPREWIDWVARLDRHRAPAGIPLHRWRQFIDDCERFLAIWAAKAAHLGWNTEALFGCALTQPLAHMQVAGLIWALRGRKIVRLYPDWASIEDPADGSQHVFNRRHIKGGQVTLPWLLR
jgi:hypothetical protein